MFNRKIDFHYVQAIFLCVCASVNKLTNAFVGQQQSAPISTLSPQPHRFDEGLKAPHHFHKQCMRYNRPLDRNIRCQRAVYERTQCVCGTRKNENENERKKKHPTNCVFECELLENSNERNGLMTDGIVDDLFSFSW